MNIMELSSKGIFVRKVRAIQLYCSGNWVLTDMMWVDCLLPRSPSTTHFWKSGPHISCRKFSVFWAREDGNGLDNSKQQICYIFHLRAAKLSSKNIYHICSFDIFSKCIKISSAFLISFIWGSKKKKKHTDSFNMYCTVSFGFFVNRCYQKSESVSHSVMSHSLRPQSTVVCQTPLSMEFSRQEYWSG